MNDDIESCDLQSDSVLDSNLNSCDAFVFGFVHCTQCNSLSQTFCLSVCVSLSYHLHTSAFHLSCTGKAELVGGHSHRGGGWVQTWYFQPWGNFSSWLELCTNPCGGYRLRLLGTQRSAQPKFCQFEIRNKFHICIFGQCEESWNF